MAIFIHLISCHLDNLCTCVIFLSQNGGLEFNKKIFFFLISVLITDTDLSLKLKKCTLILEEEVDGRTILFKDVLSTFIII